MTNPAPWLNDDRHEPTAEHKALLESQPHTIEEAVRVYLTADFNGIGQWVVDGATLDGQALFSEYDNGPLNEACECDKPDECEAHRQRAETDFGLPDAHDLLLMLASAYGYDLTPRPTP